MSFKSNRGPYPYTRMRRNRATDFSRRLMHEKRTSLLTILSCRYLSSREFCSLNLSHRCPACQSAFYRPLLVLEAKQIAALGIPAVALFPVVSPDLKSLLSRGSLQSRGLGSTSCSSHKSKQFQT